MATPTIVEVAGKDAVAASWVASVKVIQDLDDGHRYVFKNEIVRGAFTVGMYSDNDRCLFVVHSSDKKVQSPSVGAALKSAFERSRIEAAVEDVVQLNGYHLELFGYRSVPGRGEAVVELDEREEAALWDQLLPSSDEDDETPQWLKKELRGPISLEASEKAFDDALRKKRESVLALRAPAPACWAGPPSTSSEDAAAWRKSAPRGPRLAAPAPQASVVWFSAAPAELHVATARTLREWQKLEWTLLRLGAPVTRVEQFPEFLGVYKDFNKTADKGKLEKAAYETFAGHLAKQGVAAGARKALPAAVQKAARAALQLAARAPHCQKCDRALSEELEMDVDGRLGKKNRFGMFCSRVCAAGRCRGCSFELGGDGRCVKRCGVDYRPVRMATLRAYLERLPKLEPAARGWCRFQLDTTAPEELERPLESLTFGGYWDISL